MSPDGTCTSSQGYVSASTDPAYLNVTSATVVDLLPYNYYTFRVTSRNAYGLSAAYLSTLPKRTAASGNKTKASNNDCIGLG